MIVGVYKVLTKGLGEATYGSRDAQHSDKTENGPSTKVKPN